MSNHILS